MAMLAVMVITMGLAGALGVTFRTIAPVVTADGAEGFVTRGWVWDMGPAIPWLVTQAVGSTIAVFMLIKAYQVGEPSYVAVFEYSVMIFGPLFAFVAFGQTIGAFQISGILMIAAAGLLLGWRASRSSEQQKVA